MPTWLPALLLFAAAPSPAPAVPPASPAPVVSPAPAPSQTVAVLPFRAPAEALGEDGLDLLASVLAAQLGELGGWKVISPEELRALLQNEANRQALGGASDDALREASGALGAREVVSGQVVRADTRLVWRVALVDQSAGAVIRRAKVSGPNLQTLAARADEVALILLGRDDEATDPDTIADRLGFESPADATAFERFRDKHPEMGTREALTAFLIRHNVESNRLAVAELVTFLLGGSANVGAIFLVTAALAMVMTLPLGPLAVVPIVGAALLGATGCSLGIASLILGGFDALNQGFAAVNPKGCCRDDAEIAEAAAQNSVRRGTGLAILLGGPLFTAFSAYALVLLGTVFLVSQSLQVLAGRTLVDQNYLSSPAYLFPVTLIQPVYLCAFLSIPLPCLAGVPVGLALLLVPDKAPVPGMEAE